MNYPFTKYIKKIVIKLKLQKNAPQNIVYKKFPSTCLRTFVTCPIIGVSENDTFNYTLLGLLLQRNYVFLFTLFLCI